MEDVHVLKINLSSLSKINVFHVYFLHFLMFWQKDVSLALNNLDIILIKVNVKKFIALEIYFIIFQLNYVVVHQFYLIKYKQLFVHNVP
jgi:hypothetical protein